MKPFNISGVENVVGRGMRVAFFLSLSSFPSFPPFFARVAYDKPERVVKMRVVLRGG